MHDTLTSTETQIHAVSAQMHDDPDEVGLPPAPPRVSPIAILGGLFLATALIAGLFFYGYLPKLKQQQHLEATAHEIKDTLTRVNVAESKLSDSTTTMLLPGDVKALDETTVYARTTGYLKRWLVDIGDDVTAGQLLAEIDTPEVDQQLRQAQAELGQLKAKLNTAKATAQLAESTFKRYVNLVKSESVTAQDYDERLADFERSKASVEAAEADVNAGMANVQRLTELQSFSKVFAPFAGTITQRSTDLGQLVTTANSSAMPLYRIAKVNPVRIFVNVPQMYAPGIAVGQTVKVVVRELPNRNIEGVITRTARAIDPATRTLLTEVQAENSDHALLTGSYVQVDLKMTRADPPVLIPASALIVNADGTHVAVVDEESHVHLQPVQVEGDFGADVGLSSGLKPGVLVVSNPGDRMVDGAKVQVNNPEMLQSKYGLRPAPETALAHEEPK